MGKSMKKQHDPTAPDDWKLVEAISHLKSPEAPETILPHVMARLQPKRPSAYRTSLRFLRYHLFGSPARAAVVACAVSLVVTVGGWFLTRDAISPRMIASQQEVLPKPVPSAFRLAQDSGRSKEITFVARFPGAMEVAVVGSFNGWNPKRNVMRKSQAGDVFTLSIALPTGRYAYAFLVDGKLLQADSGALMQEDDGFGNTNSVLVIEEDGNPQLGRDNHGRSL